MRQAADVLGARAQGQRWRHGQHIVSYPKCLGSPPGCRAGSRGTLWRRRMTETGHEQGIEARGLQGVLETDQDLQGGRRGPAFELGNGDPATADLGGELGLGEMALVAVVADTNTGTGHTPLLSAPVVVCM
jgi:hypothetical protein